VTDHLGRRPPSLDGLIVADFSSALAGPYLTMLLGDLGATIVKVESPTGDVTRAWGPPWHGIASTYFHAVNRNKRSIVLDLATAADRDDKVAVGDAEALVRRHARMGVAHRARHDTRQEVARGLVRQGRQDARHEVQLDVLAKTRPIALVECCQDRDRAVEATQHVHQRDADLELGTALGPGDGHQPADRLEEQVVTRQ